MCLGLGFTFPIVVHPVCALKLHKDDTESLIRRLGKFGINISRTVLVISLAVLASVVPDFGVFVSLVGSTVRDILECALSTQPSMGHPLGGESDLHFG
ncbi:hypothetical protein V6N13_111452 [Hibiscus sabdariffa]